MPSSAAGGSTFAEDPARAFDEARIIWSAAVDPAVLTVSACAPGAGTFDLATRPHVVAVDRCGREHVTVSSRHGIVRLDVVSGSVRAGPVALRVHLGCNGAAVPRLAALDRLLRLLGVRDPGRRGDRADPRLARLVEALRVADAIADGASLSGIATALRGTGSPDDEWPGEGDHRKSSVRRRVALARRLLAGGPADVLHQRV